MGKQRGNQQGESPLVRIFSNETPFLILFTCYTILSWLGPVTDKIRPFVYPLTIWAALILLAQTLRFKLSYLRFVALGVGMAICYSATVFINRDFSPLSEQLQSVIWIFIFSVLIFGVAFRQDRLRKNISAVTGVFTILIFLCSLISLATYYAQIQPFLLQQDGSYILVGFFNGRLFGIYRDPNYAAVLAVIAFALGLHYALFEKKSWVKTIFFSLNAVVQIMYLALSYSRTGLVIFVLMLLFFIPADYYYRKRKGSTRHKPRLFAGLALRLVFAIAIICLIRYPFWTLYDGVPATPIVPSATEEEGTEGVIERAGRGTQHKKGDLKKEIVHEIKLRDEEEAKASSQVRLDLMSESFQLLKQKPLLGTGDRNIKILAKTHLPNSLLSEGWVPHNGYVYVLLTNGLLGAVLLLLLILFSFIRWIKHLKKAGDGFVQNWMLGIPVFILAASALFLQDLFNTMSPGALLFWLFLGACSRPLQRVEQLEEERAQ